jgi:hypothetical protein
MRDVRNEDMYLLSEIADKMDITFPKMPKIADKATKQEKEALQKDYGMELITMLVKKIYKAKDEINQLIANVSEKTPEEVSKMSIKETVSTLTTILKQDGVLDFFK